MAADEPAFEATLTNCLADAAQRGDTERFSELYARVAPRLHVWADLRLPAWVRCNVEPDDIVQEIWARAIIKFHEFDSARAPFGGWLIGFARRVLAEFLRRGIAQQGEGGGNRITLTNFDQLPDRATTIMRRVARKSDGEILARRVRELEQADQLLLRLRVLEDLTHEEVARELKITPAAARKKWQRLRERLKKMDFAKELIGPD